MVKEINTQGEVDKFFTLKYPINSPTKGLNLRAEIHKMTSSYRVH